MDKNNITGLVLIAAIMFGFFYLTRPRHTEQNTATTPVSESTAPQQAQAGSTAGIFTDTDSMLLARTIRLLGTEETDGSFSYHADGLNLIMSPEGNISGTVTAADDTASVADIMANRAPQSTADLVRALTDGAMRYQGLARYLGGEPTETVLENDLVKVTISSLGAQISRMELKKYKTELGTEPSDIVLFHGDTDYYGFAFNTSDQRIDTKNFNFETSSEGDSAVVMTLHPTAGASWSIRYALSPDNYLVRMSVEQSGMDSYLPVNTSTMDFYWHQKMARNEKGRTFEERNSAIYYKYVGESPDDLNSAKNDSEELNGRVRWVSFKNQFFSSVIVARDAFSSANLRSTVLKDSPAYLKDMNMEAILPYSAENGTAASFDFYFGPNDYSILSGLDKTLDVGEDLSLTRLIPLGWGLFRWINTLIVIPVFNFLEGTFISNYGIIILLLTIFIKIIIFPFTFKSFKSQAKMRVLAPEISRINEKYPNQDDALKRQQETMALYSRAGASPFSGCLPMLLQMPVLIAMFSFFPSAIELRGQSFLWAHDLSAPDAIFTLPFTIPFYGNHVSLFCLLMTAVNIIYIRISMNSQPTGASMPGMKLMQYLMPVMFLFLFNDYASGLSYYYFLSLLITIVQTWIFRRFTNEDKLRAEMAENAKKPRKKSGWMARLEEASKQAQAAQKRQARRR